MKILRNTSAGRGGRFTAPRAAALALFVFTSGAAVAQQVGLSDTRYDGGRRALLAADLDRAARLANTGDRLVRAPLPPELPPAHRLRGDVILPESGYSGGEDPDTWSDGVIPFVLDDEFSDAQVEAIILAMQEWEQVATVDFVPFDGGLFSKKLEIVSTGPTGATMAGVGQMPDAKCYLADWALDDYAVHHELGHVLGYHHEHQREDRDAYVLFNEDNIEPSQLDNFLPTEGGTYGPYDYDSLMHYGTYAFAIDSSIPTIQATLPGAQALIGQRTHLSEWDRTTMSFMYPEGDWVFYASGGGLFENGSFFKPYQGGGLEALLDDVDPGGSLIVLDALEEGLSEPVTQVVTLRAPVGGLVLR